MQTEKPLIISQQLPAEYRPKWMRLRSKLLDKGLTVTAWLAGCIEAALADVEPTVPMQSTIATRPLEPKVDMHAHIAEQAKVAQSKPRVSTLPGLKVIKTAADLPPELRDDEQPAEWKDVHVAHGQVTVTPRADPPPLADDPESDEPPPIPFDPKVVKAGEFFIESTKQWQGYDNDEADATTMLTGAMTKAKLPFKFASEVKRWLAENEPDRIPAGWGK